MLVLAHGVGEPEDLPISYTSAMVGGAWVLTFTFAVVFFAWRTPRFTADAPGRPLPPWLVTVIDSRPVRAGVAGVALLLTAWILLAAFFGPNTDENPFPGNVYVLLWVGMPVLSLLIGPIWRVVSPTRTIHTALHRRQADRYPHEWGYWPAAIGLFAFTWLELASPSPDSVPVLRVWLLIYVVFMLAGGFITGPLWFRRADPFDTYSVVASRLSPFRRNRATGVPVAGNPMNTLLTMPVRPGTLAVLAVLLGSTAFDSFTEFPQWKSFADRDDATDVAAASLALLGFVLIVATTFWLAAQATGGVDSRRRGELPGKMAHSLIPIAVGYVLAHYASYLVDRGQDAVIALGDPLDRGWNVLWLRDIQPEHVFAEHPGLLAGTKVVFVLAGHIIAVFAAHDRALGLLPRAHQRTGQLAMMLTMVAYTFLGLYLLLGG
ncbi:hypothetical protein [Aldersonia kunmingensis]|uniref:hypothetical protein n=1 Tax=Aldersonia kunmingensis TaxID=408066 RepID=UPI00082C955C|nr:hypothetical protein [Aldersonia kunmingensis]